MSLDFAVENAKWLEIIKHQKKAANSNDTSVKKIWKDKEDTFRRKHGMAVRDDASPVSAEEFEEFMKKRSNGKQ